MPEFHCIDDASEDILEDIEVFPVPMKCSFNSFFETFPNNALPERSGIKTGFSGLLDMNPSSARE
jgi:hypothetical protein